MSLVVRRPASGTVSGSVSGAVSGSASGTERAAEAERDAGTPHEDRLARARAALGAAERSAARWGGRLDRTALRSIGGDPAGAPRMRAVPAGPERTADPDRTAPATEPALEPLADGTRLPVPAPLAGLFPRTGLRAGSAVAVDGAATTSLLLSLAVAAAGQDAWCAIAGMPDLGLRAAIDAGLDPARLALAPTPGEQAPQVLSALADGIGVLVLGPDLVLAPALWRSLLGRARAADTLVLAARPPGRADLALTAATLGWQGLGAGTGRLRRRRLAVTSAGRGLAGEHRVEVLLPEVGGMIGVAPPARREQAALREQGVLGTVPAEVAATAVPTTAVPPTEAPAPRPLHAARRAG
ncbi:hypothetical protein ACFSDA_12000 [Brachybacterium rhamnosum]|uniref:Recombinase A n=1 Tax=Brachybacterium rhamnosum TaxID=173361 RepID=A0ABW4Q241_9MICO